ncbi:GIY-YIG nuclease family protein [Lactococcus petauri]
MGIFGNLFRTNTTDKKVENNHLQKNWEFRRGETITLDFEIPITENNRVENTPEMFCITLKLKDEYKNIGTVSNYVRIIFADEVKFQEFDSGYYIYGFKDPVKTIDLVQEFDLIPVSFEFKLNTNILKMEDLIDKFNYQFELTTSREFSSIFNIIKNEYSFDIRTKYDWETIPTENIETYISSLEGLILGLDTKSHWKTILEIKNKIIIIQENLRGSKISQDEFQEIKNNYFTELRQYASLLIIKTYYSQVKNRFWIKEVYPTKSSISEKQKQIIGKFPIYDLELQKMAMPFEKEAIRNNHSKNSNNMPMPSENIMRDKIEGIGYISEKFTPQIFNYMSNSPTNDYTGVYIIYNGSKEKYYVGQAKKVMNRVYKHFLGKGGNAGSYNFFNDYQSGEAFEVWTVRLRESEFDSLDELERRTIEYYQAYDLGYNENRGNKN